LTTGHAGMKTVFMRKAISTFTTLLLLGLVAQAQQYLSSGENYYDDRAGIVYNRELRSTLSSIPTALLSAPRSVRSEPTI